MTCEKERVNSPFHSRRRPSANRRSRGSFCNRARPRERGSSEMTGPEPRHRALHHAIADPDACSRRKPSRRKPDGRRRCHPLRSAINGYETGADGKIVGLYAKDNAVSNTAEIHFVVGADGSITKPKDKSRMAVAA